MKLGGWRWLWLTAAVVLLDQLTKAWVSAHFAPGENLTLLPVLNLTLRYNPGAAFSMLADASGWQRWFFTALAIAVGIGILVWLRRLDGRNQRLLACALAFILAGDLGNLIDRLQLGHVVDFIEVHWHESRFPAFNVADSAITVGAVLLILEALLEQRRKPH